MLAALKVLAVVALIALGAAVGIPPGGFADFQFGDGLRVVAGALIVASPAALALVLTMVRRRLSFTIAMLVGSFSWLALALIQTIRMRAAPDGQDGIAILLIVCGGWVWIVLTAVVGEAVHDLRLRDVNNRN